MAYTNSENLNLKIQDDEEFLSIEPTAENFRLIDAAYGAIRALVEALNNSVNINHSAVNAALDNKADKTHAHTADEVSETSTKKLMTADERTKLGAIANGATKNIVDSELSETSTNAPENRVVTAALGTKANATHTHTADEVSETGARKLMTADERTKLSGIAAGATKTIVDQVLDKDSTNAVANKVVHKEIINLTQMSLVSGVSTSILANHVAQQGHFGETDTGTSGKIWLGETLIQWGEIKKSNSEANKTEQVNITFDSGYGYKSKSGFIVFCTVYATDPATASVAPSGRTAGGFTLNYRCNTTKESTICWLTVGRGTKNATEEIFES